MLGARLKLLGGWNSSERIVVEPDRAEREKFSGVAILETFNAPCCLIRKVDKRTLNAKSAFHTAA